jgi:hypothetical protein
MYAQEGLQGDTVLNKYAYLKEKEPLLRQKHRPNDPRSLNGLLTDIFQALGALDVLYHSYSDAKAADMQTYTEHETVSKEFLESCAHDEEAISGLIRMARTKIESIRNIKIYDDERIQKEFQDTLKYNVKNLMDIVKQIKNRVTTYQNFNKEHGRGLSGIENVQKTIDNVEAICNLID